MLVPSYPSRTTHETVHSNAPDALVIRSIVVVVLVDVRRRELQPAAPTSSASTASLAERTTYLPREVTNPEVSGTEFALFAQDRWRVNDRLNFELGLRADFDDVVEGANYSPRLGCR